MDIHEREMPDLRGGNFSFHVGRKRKAAQLVVREVPEDSSVPWLATARARQAAAGAETMKMDFRVFLDGAVPIDEKIKHARHGQVLAMWAGFGRRAGPVFIVDEVGCDEDEIMYDLMHENLHIVLDGVGEYKASEAIDKENNQKRYVNERLWNSFGGITVTFWPRVQPDK